MLVFLAFLGMSFGLGLYARQPGSTRHRTLIAIASLLVCAAYFCFSAL